VGWMKLGRVIQAFVQFVEFVTGQLPVRVLSGEPQFRMTHLGQGHYFAKSWCVLWLGRLTVAARQTDHENEATGE